MSEPQPVHIPNLTIQYFPRTAEGQAIIASMKVFCLGGRLYQGIKGGGYAVTVEKLLIDEELEAVHDVDGTKDKVWAERNSRNASRGYRKDEELIKRENVRANQRLKDLQLQKLEQEIAPAQVAQTTMEQVPCGLCDKVSPLGHNNPQAWKTGHRMGAHKDKAK